MLEDEYPITIELVDIFSLLIIGTNKNQLIILHFEKSLDLSFKILSKFSI